MLTKRQEDFTLNLFKGMTHREAWKEAGYSTRYPIAHIDRDASLLAHHPKVIQRMKELRDEAASALVMTKQQILERHSEIARARMSDFVECGADGAWINIGLDGCQSAALQGVKSRTEYDDDKSHPAIITEIKLHDPVKSMAEIARLQGYYAQPDSPPQNNIYINNLNINPRDRILEKLAEIHQRIGGNGHLLGEGKNGITG